MVTSKMWYEEGYNACRAGYAAVSCPYDEGSEPHDQWHKGFKDAVKAIEEFKHQLYIHSTIVGL